ncbi:unnamed protein product [Porites evermanni]|uniref:GTP-binding protein Rhes n=1 Tax=Porites evermanni TaxID=104178 RepID=A0ABN8PMU9_9CNID|nr:unnamed protein product [Porites evermanni]
MSLLRARPNLSFKRKTSSLEKAEKHMKFTVAFFGDSGVGKSSIIRNLVGEGYIQEHIPTVEEFYATQMIYRNKTYEFDIIDSSGSYEFPAMRRIAIQKADAVVLVYSVDRPKSFTKLEIYLDEIQKCCADSNRRIPVIIVSNKADLPNLSEPTFADARGIEISACDYLESLWECQWLSTSARFNLNIAAIFYKLLEKLCPEKKIRHRSTILKNKFR